MSRLVWELPEALRLKIRSLFGFGNGSECYSIVLRKWDVGVAREVSEKLEDALLNMAGGHNGLAVRAGMFEDPTVWRDAVWCEAEWPEEEKPE